MLKRAAQRLAGSPLWFLIGLLSAVASAVAIASGESLAAGVGLAVLILGLIGLVGLRQQSRGLETVRKLEGSLRALQDESSRTRKDVATAAERLTQAQEDSILATREDFEGSLRSLEDRLHDRMEAFRLSGDGTKAAFEKLRDQAAEVQRELRSVRDSVTESALGANDRTVQLRGGEGFGAVPGLGSVREVAESLGGREQGPDGWAGLDWATSTAALQDLARRVDDDPTAPENPVHPLFDPVHYLETSGSAASRDGALLDYLQGGWRDPRAHPHALFDSNWYISRYGTPAGPPLLDYLLRESDPEPRHPNPLFDPQWYADQVGIDRRRGSVLAHYVLAGAREGRAPSSLFDPAELDRRIPLAGDHDRLSLFLRLEASGLLPGASSDAIRNGSPTMAEREQRWDYLVSGLYRDRDTVTLFRIVGNDLPPRHESGQTVANVRFVLEHEQLPSQVERRWIVNRVIDADAERDLMHLLKSAGEHVTRIPVDRAQIGCWDWSRIPAGTPLHAQSVETGHGSGRGKALYREKAGELIGINGARNTALKVGRRRSKWTLPLDGGIFLTRSAWREILDAIQARPYVRYVAIPSTRRLDPRLLTEDGFRPPADGEHMLLFRRDAREEFDTWWPYGFRDKVALLYRLGIPGPWDDWAWEGLPVRRGDSPDAYRFTIAGWGARLPTGTTITDLDRGARFAARGIGVAQLCDRFEADGLRIPRSTDGLLFPVASLRGSRAPSGPALPDEHRRLVEGFLADTSADSPDRLSDQVATRWAQTVAALLWRRDDVGSIAALGSLEEALQACVATSLQDDGEASGDGVRWLLAWDLRALRLAGTQDEPIDGPEGGLDTRLLELAERFVLKQDSAAPDVGESGSWYSVHQLACGLATGRTEIAARALRDLQERLLEQIGPDGQLTAIVAGPGINQRTASLLEAWTLADVLLRPSGVHFVDLDVGGRTVRQAVSACVQEAAVTGGLDSALQHRVRAVAQTLLPSDDGWSTWSSTTPAVPVELGGSSHLPPFWMLVHPRGQPD